MEGRSEPCHAGLYSRFSIASKGVFDLFARSFIPAESFQGGRLYNIHEVILYRNNRYLPDNVNPESKYKSL